MAASPMPSVLPQGQSDPLAELRDIHLPQTLDLFPPAPGWWLLALASLIAVGYGCYKLYCYWRANAYRREANRQLHALKKAYLDDQDAKRCLLEINDLLKRTALTAYPRADVAPITGEAWVDFLDRTSGSREFSMGPGQVLIDSQYRCDSQPDVIALAEVSQHWIKKHRRGDTHAGV